MKIRTITCHHSYNHGAMLQAFALVKYLQSQGHDAAVIDYQPDYMPTHKVDPAYVSVGFFSIFGIRQLYGWYKKIQAPKRKSYYDLEQNRRDAFELFFNQFIPVTQNKYATVKQLRANPPEADLYIAGSDQIWNTNLKNGRDAAFYLDFGSPKRRISYAASFATQNLSPRFSGTVRRRLANFDAISLREQSGIHILESLGYHGITVVDPVFLLERHFWDEVLKTQEKEGQCDSVEYILTYDFELNGSVIEPIAVRLANLLNCKIFSVGPINQKYADKSFVCCSPLKFVSLIKHARCVISNSFHGTAFSMIYGKNFFVVKRKDGLNSRMQDLLNHYSLSERLIDSTVADEILLKNIEYSAVANVLEQDINLSKSFLQEQIDLVN